MEMNPFGHSFMNPNEPLVGDEAKYGRDTLTLNYPIEHGIVTNW